MNHLAQIKSTFRNNDKKKTNSLLLLIVTVAGFGSKLQLPKNKFYLPPTTTHNPVAIDSMKLF